MHSGAYRELRFRILRLILQTAPVDRNVNAVSLCCGTGSEVITLSRTLRKDSTITGVDIDANALCIARERARVLAGSASVSFIQADAQTYPLADVDFACCALGLRYLEDPVAAVNLWLDTLNPGGVLMLVDWKSDILDLVLRSVKGFAKNRSRIEIDNVVGVDIVEIRKPK